MHFYESYILKRVQMNNLQEFMLFMIRVKLKLICLDIIDIDHFRRKTKV